MASIVLLPLRLEQKNETVMKKNRLLWAFLASMVLFLASCGQDDPIEPGNEPGNIPEAKAENPRIKAAVEAMAAEAATAAPKLTGIEVWQEGYLDSGAWLNGTSSGTRHHVWSVTKSFTSMAVGIAVGEGKLRLTDKVEDIFPDEVAAARKSMKYNGKEMSDEQSANLAALTVEDLLMMASGHKKDSSTEYAQKYKITLALNIRKYLTADSFNVTAMMDDVGTNVPELFFGYPFDAAPGTKFCYDSFGSCMLAEIIKKKTGEDVADYLADRLFKPLGIAPTWDKAGSISAGGWGLHLTTGEMVSFGKMLFYGGKWGSGSIVPSDYVKAATSDKIAHASHSGKDYGTTGYGYQIWTRSDGSMFECMGLFGQYIIVLPDKKAVIALTSATSVDFTNVTLSDLAAIIDMFNGGANGQAADALNLAWKHIIPALK